MQILGRKRTYDLTFGSSVGPACTCVYSNLSDAGTSSTTSGTTTTTVTQDGESTITRLPSLPERRVRFQVVEQTPGEEPLPRGENSVFFFRIQSENKLFVKDI